MLEKIEHKLIEPGECPRCGGPNTDSLGDDGTNSTGYICLDCDAENPGADVESPGYYEVVWVDIVGSVVWTDENGQEHEVHDTEYLHYLAAQDLLEIAVLFEDLTRNGIQPGSEDLERLQHVIAQAKGQAHE